MKKLKALLVQIAVPHVSLNYRRIVKNNIPLAAGYLKAFAHKRDLLKNCDIDILEYQYQDLGGDSLLIKKLVDLSPDVIGFSLYPWNLSRSLFIASEIKKIKPDIIILAGGPEVDENNPIVLNSSPIDIFVIGEGEITFCELLEHFIYKKPELCGINGIIYKKDNEILTTPPRDLIQDLNDIPSPYQLGFIKPENHNYFMWLEAQRGCLFNCKYCSWPRKGAHRKFGFSAERLRQELEFAKKNKVRFIGFIDGSFNLVPDFTGICELIKEVNFEKKITFSASCYADFITPKTAKLLSDCNFSLISIGLQSSNENVLKNISRKTNPQKLISAVQSLRECGIKVMISVILGLPGETPQTFQETLDFLTQNKLVDIFEEDYLIKGYKDDDCQVICYPLSVAPGTPLGKEISRWGFKVQGQPSYRILETKDFSFAELKKSLEKIRKVGYFEPDIMFNFMPPGFAEFVQGAYPYETNCGGGRLNINNEAPPVTKIILEIDSSGQNVKQMQDLALKLYSRLARTVTLWFKCGNLSEDKRLINAFLRNISRFNPHAVWNIILETSAPFSPDVMEEIKKHIYYIPNYLDYEGIFFAENPNQEFLRVSARIFTVFMLKGGSLKIRRPRHNEIKPYYWRLSCSKEFICAPGFIPQRNPESKEAAADLNELLMDNSNGIIIDFAPRLTIAEIVDCLKHIHSNNALNKEIFFSNWVIQRVWDIEYRKYAETLGTEENILNIDSGLKNLNLTVFNRALLLNHLEKWLEAKKEIIRTA